jgi:hypothetical protein
VRVFNPAVPNSSSDHEESGSATILVGVFTCSRGGATAGSICDDESPLDLAIIRYGMAKRLHGPA